MKQGYNDRMDESLAIRDGAKSQSMMDRRDEAKAMNRAMGTSAVPSLKRAYGSVKSMGRKAKR